MPAQTSGHIRKYLRKRKLRKAAVLRILAAVMENQAAAAAAAAGAEASNTPGSNSNAVNVNSSDYHNEFFNTGRIGRRNALPDILGYNCSTTSTADLPTRLSALTTDDSPTPSTSGLSNTVEANASIDRNAPSTSTAGSTSQSAAACSSSTQPVNESMNT